MLRRAAVVDGDDPSAGSLRKSEGDRPIAEAGAKVIPPAMQVEDGAPWAIEPARLDGLPSARSHACGFDQDPLRDAHAADGLLQNPARPGDVESPSGMRF